MKSVLKGGGGCTGVNWSYVGKNRGSLYDINHAQCYVSMRKRDFNPWFEILGNWRKVGVGGMLKWVGQTFGK